MHPSNLKKLILFLGALLLLSSVFGAQKKKKSKSQYEKPNILKRAWGDVTTRNNYYFNASELYKELVHNYEFSRVINYSNLLPFYYHDSSDFSAYQGDLETIEKKVGIVLQLHDYSRWRDNAYLLLGKSQFLRKQYDTSLTTFQYIVTTMKPGMMNNKLEFSNKDRLKYIRKRQKELEKAAGKKKQIIEFQYKKQQEEAKEKAEDARDKQKAAIDKKKKELEEIIKAKKKIIALHKKGKKIPPELIAKAKGKSSSMDTTVMKANTSVKKSDKPNFDPKLPYVLMGDQYVKNPYYKDPNDDKQIQSGADSLTYKQEAKKDKMSFWEKIKHKPSRPDAIVWMSKTLIQLHNYADARSMIAYGKSLRKLTKKQRREFHLVEAYYYTSRNDYLPATESLENALLYIKKKKNKAYYEYLLAQLYEKNNQALDALDYYKKASKHTKDDELHLYAQIQQARLYVIHPELGSEDVPKMLNKLVKRNKYSDQADEVYYALSRYYYYVKDTSGAIASLLKAIKYCKDDLAQKGKSYLRLGEIYYDKEDYYTAARYYDSAVAYLPNTTPDYAEVVSRKSVLSNLAQYKKTINEQDSLQHLGKMSPKELDEYLAQLAKQEKKKNRFSSDEATNNGTTNSGLAATSDVSNGLWYFYNPEARSRGYNEFKQIWGDRKLEDYWRRSNKSLTIDESLQQLNTNNTVDTAKSKTKSIKDIAANPEMQIPKTPEEFMASDKLIAKALFGTGEIFKNKLNNLPKAKAAFDELISRFPNSDNDAKAHYYLYLIYTEQNLNGLAQKEKDYILQNYPMSEVAEVIQNMNKPKTQGVSEETSAKFYASTYKSFLDGNYNDVIKNNSLAKLKYPSAFEIPQFEFLNAVSFGKLKQYNEYKKALSEIIAKYPTGEIKEKAQTYLMTYLQIENSLVDTTPEIAVNTIQTTVDSSVSWGYDTTGLIFLIELKDPYIRINDVIKNVENFNNKNFKDDKVKVNTHFIGNSAFIQIKRFDGLTLAKKYSTLIQANPTLILGQGNEFKADYYIVAPSNFRKISTMDKLKSYSKYYIENY